ncbi:MAG: 3'(2'),5'-bisphosphate nucleotidase CysQ [Gemmatimonadales bacterium]
MSRAEDVARIREGLMAAAEAVSPFRPGSVEFRRKDVTGDPVTAADQAANVVLREILPREGEGWLSEESADDPSRLGKERVWVVDPIDGTREFIQGIPEWCVSIGLVEQGTPVAGGIYNPITDELIVGAVGSGVTYNGAPAEVTAPNGGSRLTVLASRSEMKRGEWGWVMDDTRYEIRACGSVAYKLGLVAAGRVDATWTLVPKSEWDVAAGTALVRAGGGMACLVDGAEPRFNKPVPKFPNFVAAGSEVARSLLARLGG